MTVTVTLHSLFGADEAQRAIIEAGVTNLEQALNHPRFAERVKAAAFTWAGFRRADGSRTQIPAGEVLDYVLSGAETGQAADYEIDLHIALAPLRRKIVGSTQLGEPGFRTAYWFIDGCVRSGDTVSPARHFIHEWCHVSGFFHRKRSGEDGDVPYQIGDIVRAVLLEDVGGLLLSEDPKMAEALAEAEDDVEDAASSTGGSEADVKP